MRPSGSFWARRMTNERRAGPEKHGQSISAAYDRAIVRAYDARKSAAAAASQRLICSPSLNSCAPRRA